MPMIRPINSDNGFGLIEALTSVVLISSAALLVESAHESSTTSDGLVLQLIKDTNLSLNSNSLYRLQRRFESAD